MSLKQKTFSGVKWTSISAFFNIIIQFIQIIILTQLLNKYDFGLMAIVMVVIGFSQLFIDMGVSNAIIYYKNITEKELSSLYWFNIASGTIFFSILLILSQFISQFYEDEKIKTLLNIVSITFLVQPFGQQFMVFLQKELKFSVIAKVEIISRLLSFFIVIILSTFNYGVYSIAFGTLIYSFSSAIGFNITGRVYYKPKFFFSYQYVKHYLNFGLFQMGDKFLNYFSLQMDTLLIGKLMGIESLGIYNIAKELTSKPYMIINPIITKVAFPVMTKINGELNKLKEIFLKTLNYLSYVNIFIYLLIFILAKPLVLLFFGNEWAKAYPLIQILALTYTLRSFGNPSGILLLSKGKSKQIFLWNLLVFVFYFLSIIIGSHWSIIGIAYSTFILQILFFVLNWYFNVKSLIDVNFFDYSSFFIKPLIITTISSVPCYFLLMYLGDNIFTLLIISILYTVIFIYIVSKFEMKLLINSIDLLPGKFKFLSKLFTKI
jgi:O-antigen/teichoic acid export membrane protein